MADRGYCRSDNNRRTSRYGYIDGNTVRKPQTRPVPERTKTERQPERRKKTSARTKRNRARALQMNFGYVAFLALAGVMTLFVCVNYLKLQAQNTTFRNQTASLESQLADLKQQNDAAYENALTSVNLDTIRDIAINKLGMVYAGEEQVKTYDDKSSDYVRQYEDVPAE